jgi:hypothetical protein
MRKGKNLRSLRFWYSFHNITSQKPDIGNCARKNLSASVRKLLQMLLGPRFSWINQLTWLFHHHEKNCLLLALSTKFGTKTKASVVSLTLQTGLHTLEGVRHRVYRVPGFPSIRAKLVPPPSPASECCSPPPFWVQGRQGDACGNSAPTKGQTPGTLTTLCTEYYNTYGVKRGFRCTLSIRVLFYSIQEYSS